MEMLRRESIQDKLGKVLKDKLEPVVHEPLPPEMVKLVQRLKEPCAVVIPFRCNHKKRT
jgi:hypothetical protein